MKDVRRSFWNKAGEVKPNVTKFTVENLNLDTEYVFRVTAINAEGQSPPLTSDKSAKPTKKLSKYFPSMVFSNYLNFSHP